MTAINIGFHLGGRVIDLRVPNQVTTSRLYELISQALATLGIMLPPGQEIQVLNKHIRLEPGYLLCDYPLANGDQLMRPRFGAQ